MAMDRNHFTRIVEIACTLNLHRKDGVHPDDFAEMFGVSKRQIYRDIRALQDLGVLVDAENGRFFLTGTFVPPVQIWPSEATVILMGLRLLASNANAYYDRITTTFNKLSCVVPPPLQEEIRRTLEWLKKQTRDDNLVRTMDTLAIAWVERRRVRIRYQAQERKASTWVTVEPYFIQPVAAQHANYLIAHSLKADALRTYKIERIEAVELLDENYEIPEAFNADEHLDPAIGIFTGQKKDKVRLRFSPNMARAALETRWHHSQTAKKQSDGSVIVTMVVSADSWELTKFILGYGKEVEVLEPAAVRQAVAKTGSEIAALYRPSSCARPLRSRAMGSGPQEL